MPYHLATSQCGKNQKGLGSLPIPFLSGVDNGARTHDTRNHNPVLCQLSYTHHIQLKARSERVARLKFVRPEKLPGAVFQHKVPSKEGKPQAQPDLQVLSRRLWHA